MVKYRHTIRKKVGKIKNNPNRHINKRKKETKKTSQINTPEYSSSRLLLETLQKEYDYDMQNLNSLYTRAGIMVAFVGTYLSLIISQINRLNMDKAINMKKAFILTTEFWMNCITIIITISSFICFVLVIATKQYQRLKISQGFNAKVAKKREDLNAKYLMDKYVEILVANQKKVALKYIYYKIGLWGTLVSLVSYTVTAIIKTIL